MNNAIKVILGSALITAAAMRAVPAFAEPAPAPEFAVSVVHTSDLDLSRAADRRVLDRRIAIAAGEVCGVASETDLKGRNAARDCRQAVLTAARAKAQAIIAVESHPTILVASRD